MNKALLLQRIDAYERLIRLDKPAGALLLLWPTLWAVWLAARGRPPLEILIVFVAGTFLMRSAGCAFNDYADRRFDPGVERTRGRPLAAGEIAPKEALVVAAVLSAVAFGFALFLNMLAIGLALVGLVVAMTYPYAKRWLALPQLHLGVAFGFGIPIAYAALINALPWECWALLAANVCYSFAYDTEYAMVDRDDDRKLGIRSSAITLGRFDVAGVMTAYLGMLAILAYTGAALRLSWPYYAGLTAAAGMMLHHYTLIRDRSREGCMRAFRYNNWIGAAILAGLVASFSL